MGLQDVILIQILLFAGILLLTIYNLLQFRLSSKKQHAFVANESNTLNLISHYLKNIDQQILLCQNITKGDGTNISYSFAKRILDTGGSIDEIVHGCKLTHGEAELLSALHKPGE